MAGQHTLGRLNTHEVWGWCVGGLSICGLWVEGAPAEVLAAVAEPPAAFEAVAVREFEPPVLALRALPQG